ncbi:hypothetical protein KUTeg_010899 [Tegillarca granosa]|uniref:DUF3504 domain-containing protein n=1 Tax=Tegillarca granosa TaxID=220873 RepID=A0ABQ9F2B2_TEGGR|nr:hypothetical protein KUTeg_010899 [Tegillarca granosa]
MLLYKKQHNEKRYQSRSEASGIHSLDTVTDSENLCPDRNGKATELNSRVPLTDINTCSRFNDDESVVKLSHCKPSNMKTFLDPELPHCSKSTNWTHAQEISVPFAPVQHHHQFMNTSTENMPFYLFTHDSSQDADSQQFIPTVVKVEPNSEDEICDTYVNNVAENSGYKNREQRNEVVEWEDSNTVMNTKQQKTDLQTQKRNSGVKKERKPKQKSGNESSTDVATRWGVKIFKEWLIMSDKDQDFEFLPLETINELLSVFYTEVRTRYGTQYSENALIAIKNALFRHLNSQPFSLGVDSLNSFWTSTKVLESVITKQKEGKEVMTEIKQNKVIKPADLDKMYTTGVLGNQDPLSLLRKVWFELILHFGGKVINSKKVTRQSFHLCFDEKGVAYYKLSDDIKIPGKTSNNTQCRMYAIPGDDLCPVYSLKLYLSKLSPRNNSLFQCPVRKKVTEDDEAWYMNLNFGHNRFVTMMSDISKAAKLSCNYTNSCVDVTRNNMLHQASANNR